VTVVAAAPPGRFTMYLVALIMTKNGEGWEDRGWTAGAMGWVVVVVVVVGGRTGRGHGVELRGVDRWDWEPQRGAGLRLRGSGISFPGPGASFVGAQAPQLTPRPNSAHVQLSSMALPTFARPPRRARAPMARCCVCKAVAKRCTHGQA
jgi:hypothetical protein